MRKTKNLHFLFNRHIRNRMRSTKIALIAVHISYNRIRKRGSALKSVDSSFWKPLRILNEPPNIPAQFPTNCIFVRFNFFSNHFIPHFSLVVYVSIDIIPAFFELLIQSHSSNQTPLIPHFSSTFTYNHAFSIFSSIFGIYIKSRIKNTTQSRMSSRL